MRYHVETLRRAIGPGYTSRARRLWHWTLWAAFKRWHNGAVLECVPCGEVHCGEPLHFHHDGCPFCDMPAMRRVPARIECPQCRAEVMATVDHFERLPWPVYAATCDACEYLITESEWNEVES